MIDKAAFAPNKHKDARLSLSLMGTQHSHRARCDVYKSSRLPSWLIPHKKTYHKQVNTIRSSISTISVDYVKYLHSDWFRCNTCMQHTCFAECARIIEMEDTHATADREPAWLGWAGKQMDPGSIPASAYRSLHELWFMDTCTINCLW